MATITEDYVSFEVAKLLKEKGFNEMTELAYELEDGHIRNDLPVSYWRNSEIGKYKFSCPTHQMAMAWLRETHNIDIDIDAAVGMLGVKVYIPYISTYKPLEGDSSKVRQIKRGIYYKDDKGVIPALQHFNSYEEAVETALMYCLENLI